MPRHRSSPAKQVLVFRFPFLDRRYALGGFFNRWVNRPVWFREQDQVTKRKVIQNDGVGHQKQTRILHGLENLTEQELSISTK